MKVKQTHTYSHPIEAIFKAYTDVGFLTAKMEALGARNVSVDVTHGCESVVVKVTREMPAEAPRALKKFVPPWNKMSQTEVWSGAEGGPYQCTIDIEIAGLPINMSGQWQLTATADGCRMDTTTDITCSVPFVGGKIAQFAGAESAESLQAEYAYVRTHVS